MNVRTGHRSLLLSVLVVAVFCGAAMARAVERDRHAHEAVSEAAVASAEPDDAAATDVDEVAATPTRFAVIGDFGTGGWGAEGVAELVHGWAPDHVLTVGDNNYPSGGADTIDANIGQRYARYIHPYTGEYGPGADANRFWPALGNHDWGWGHVRAHEDYFELPGNERYYDVVLGPVHLFVLDTHDYEPDGYEWGSEQSRWFVERIATSTAPFQVVTMHYPPFSSGHHGSREETRWPFADLGVDLVLAGHDHHYERLTVDGIPYVIVGTGGARLREEGRRHPASRAFRTGVFGALRIDASTRALRLHVETIDGEVLDELELRAGVPAGRHEPWLVAPGARWRYSDALEASHGAFEALTRNASLGYAPLGHGGYFVETRHDDRDGAARWYAHTFHVDDPSDISALELRLRADDGAIVYLNWREVMRHNVVEDPAGTIAADDTVGWVGVDPDTIAIDPALLRAGDNIVTVAVLQTDGGRGDAFFDAELLRVETDAP